MAPEANPTVIMCRLLLEVFSRCCNTLGAASLNVRQSESLCVCVCVCVCMGVWLCVCVCMCV